MRRAQTLGWQSPATYAEIVMQERRDLEARLKRLAQARKLIVAAEPDLKRLRDNKIHFSIDGRFGLIEDCRADVCTGRAINALRVDTGISDAGGDRAVRALLDLGYVLERRHGDARWPSAVLRRPKTQIRLIVRCTPVFFASLADVEAE
jgi:hypothetical protein